MKKEAKKKQYTCNNVFDERNHFLRHIPKTVRNELKGFQLGYHTYIQWFKLLHMGTIKKHYTYVLNLHNNYHLRYVVMYVFITYVSLIGTMREAICRYNCLIFNMECGIHLKERY